MINGPLLIERKLKLSLKVVPVIRSYNCFNILRCTRTHLVNLMEDRMCSGPKSFPACDSRKHQSDTLRNKLRERNKEREKPMGRGCSDL